MVEKTIIIITTDGTIDNAISPDAHDHIKNQLEFAGASDGFAAWYVLQHYRGTRNVHNPFISYFTREFTFVLTK